MDNRGRDVPKRKISRRAFLARAGASVGVGAAATFGYTWRIEPHWIETVRLSLPIAGLPPALVGKTLVQISDLHIGYVVDDQYITSVLRRVSAMTPDVVVITGDFMTCTGNEQVRKVMRHMGTLTPGRIATIGILGNHDYGKMWHNVAAADTLAGRLRESGMTVLRNQVTDVCGLQVAGIDDLWSPRFDAAGTLARLNPAAPSLVLCHNPDAVDLPVWSGYRGWILAGHTHGGQCKPPFLTPPLLPVTDRRYVAGRYDLAGDRTLYINRGVGYIRRLRFNARPEITVFTLAAA